MMTASRNSAYELMRLVAQWFIVAYHIFLFYFVLNNDNPEPIFKAIWIPLHIGVPLFVLLSGFFKIKLSIRGFLRIIANLFVYGLVFSLVYLLITGGNIGWENFCFVSNTGSWFVRTYLILYVLSPIINRFITNSTNHVRLLVLSIFGYIALWIGWNNFDQTMHEGYDILNFIFLYLLGNTLSEYQKQLGKIPTWSVICLWLLFNAVFMIAFCNGGTYRDFFFNFVFPYNSPGIVINAVLFFMLFMRLSFQSKVINYLATSSLAIYLIHSSNLIFRIIVKDGSLWIQEYAKNSGGQISMVFLYSLVVIIACMAIDKVLTPLWKLVDNVAEKLTYTQLGRVVEEYSYR